MFEVIVVTPDEARVAEAGGADRLELVSALSEGGLTPGFGLLKHVVAAVAIPVNVMIRPHARGFRYRDSEVEVMIDEIQAAREAGANGVVLGVLDEAHRVHRGHLEKLLSCAEGLEVTFHRAIDAAEGPVAAARVLSHYPQIRTLLSSGGPGRIEDQTGVLASMRAAAHPIRIMAGGGLTLANTARIVQEGGVHDCHYGTAVRRGGAVDGELDPAALGDLKRLLVHNGVTTGALA